MEKKYQDNQDNKDKKGIRDQIGGILEKAGHKISDAGATKVGQKVHDLGDKVEKTHANPLHPHDV